MPVIAFFFIFAALLTLGLFFLWKKFIEIPDVPLLQDLSKAIPEDASYEIITREKLLEFKSSPLAQHSLSHELRTANEAGVECILLVHGTFVGDDPFHLISLLETSLPETSHKMISLFKDHTRKAGHFLTKDLGNFSEIHAKTLREASKGKIQIENFTWSSANHHFARVMGCLDLIESIHTKSITSKKRILLLGHSHAGQIFSLLTHLLHNKKMRDFIFEVLETHQIHTFKYHKMLKKINKINIDIVTLGTPTRYSWSLNKKIRLLHFINHRTADVLGGGFKGFMNTKDGDYIQQWGVQGSDIISPIKHEQKINLELDKILGIGSHLELFKQNIMLRHRLHNQGHHYLVDYGDNSLTPNFLKSGFGHGIYTKIDLLSFHFSYINRYLNQ